LGSSKILIEFNAQRNWRSLETTPTTPENNQFLLLLLNLLVIGTGIYSAILIFNYFSA